MNDKKYINIPVALAEKIEAMSGDDVLMERAVDEYFQWSVSAIVANLESLDETVVQYKALNVKARNDFRVAALDMSKKSETVWDDWDRAMPRITSKIAKMRGELEPLKKNLDDINDVINKINTWDVERLLKTMHEVECASSGTLKIIAFLMDNYN